MSIFGRGDPWGVPLEIAGGAPPDDQRSRNADALSSSSSDSTHHSWLLHTVSDRSHTRRKKYVDLGCVIVSRRIFLWSLGGVLSLALLVALIVTVEKVAPRRHPSAPPPDNYTVALHDALMFFNAQRSGKLPIGNNVTWRGNSGMEDGFLDGMDLVGGFYDAGSAAKYNFPASFAMTMLSWSVIEYGGKYEAVGELDHAKEIIEWGVDYIMRAFEGSGNKIVDVVAVVDGYPNDENCWMRPEDINYPRHARKCSVCSDLASEMAAALASASIVFKGNITYSRMLVHGAKMLWEFARGSRGIYNDGGDSRFYKSTGFVDEYIWGGTWLYYATGNISYLNVLAEDFINGNLTLGDPAYRILSWDKKLIGAQVLLSRLRMFLSPGYPLEETLQKFHNQTGIVMCSYLPFFTSFKRTKGGLIQLNNGGPQPLQYVVNSIFLTSLFSDYLDAVDAPGWFCGPDFYTTDTLRDFAMTQMDYILGDNPRKMSYVVGFGSQYPKHIHHRGASIPKNGIKYGCKEGSKWRDTTNPNPNVITGAMVAGPDKLDGFYDDRKNYNYTEPTLMGNAGLVAALVSLSGGRGQLDRNTMFSSVQPMFPMGPPPPPPWHP